MGLDWPYITPLMKPSITNLFEFSEVAAVLMKQSGSKRSKLALHTTRSANLHAAKLFRRPCNYSEKNVNNVLEIKNFGQVIVKSKAKLKLKNSKNNFKNLKF